MTPQEAAAFRRAIESTFHIKRPVRSRPKLPEIDKLFAQNMDFAKRSGLRKSDVKKAIRKARAGR